MWAVRASTVFAAVQGGTKEVGGGILTSAIDIVVLEIVAHFDPIGGVVRSMVLGSNSAEKSGRSRSI